MRSLAAPNPISSPTPAFERPLRRASGALAALCCLLVLIALAVPVEAHAEGSPKAPQTPATGGTASTGDADLKRAREAFQRGVQAAERLDYTTAAERFREALALHYAPAVAFNLAAALAELKQPVEAYNLVHEVLAASDVPSAVRPRAEKLAEALELEIAKLTVTTNGSTSDVSATVDGAALPPALLGRPQAMLPGPHEVTALRSGQVVSRRTVELAPRTTTIVDLSLIVTESVAAAPPPPVVPSADEDGHRDDRRRRKVLWIGVGAGAAVLAGAAVATIFLVKNRDDGGQEAPVRGDSGVLTW